MQNANGPLLISPKEKSNFKSEGMTMSKETKDFGQTSAVGQFQFLTLAEWNARHKAGRFVQLYHSDRFLVKSVSRYLGEGIKAGCGVIAICTELHRVELERRMRVEGIDVDSALSKGQLALLDAVETLAKVMVNGSPDKRLFQEVIGDIVAKTVAGCDGLRVFSEMVALLWSAGNRSGTVQFEEFWNEMAIARSFSLLNAYPVYDFDETLNGAAFSKICEEHSYFLPLEAFIAAKLSPNERLLEIGHLQQKANVLEGELKDRAQRELASKRLAALVESSGDAIIFRDLNGIIKTWNHGAERIFGYRADEAIGKPVTILVPDDRQDEENDMLARIRHGERFNEYETVRRRKDGRLLDVSLTISPVRDDLGRIIGASKIAHDVSRRKRAEHELRESLEREKEAARMKDNFLAMLSHELRMPLNPALLIASDRAADPALPPEIQADFGTIQRNVEVQARLIDDLLDLSRLAYGKIRLNMATVDAHAVMREAIHTVEESASSKRIEIIAKLNAEHSSIYADRVRLQQIFWNVLKNAVKFTPEGGKISVETLTGSKNDTWIARITDTGIGMTPDELERIFQAFAQGNHAMEKSSEYGGLGLGLSIAQRLVELHSGKIEASSDGRDQGTTFSLQFPLIT